MPNPESSERRIDSSGIDTKKELGNKIKTWGKILGFIGIMSAGGGVMARFAPEVIRYAEKHQEELKREFDMRAQQELEISNAYKNLQQECSAALVEYERGKKLQQETIQKLRGVWKAVQEIQMVYPDAEKETEIKGTTIYVDSPITIHSSETTDKMVRLPPFPSWEGDSSQWGVFLYQWREIAKTKQEKFFQRYQNTTRQKSMVPQ